MLVQEFWDEVKSDVENRDWRVGQSMFNILFDEEIPGLDTIRGSLDDPFYRVKTFSSAKQWFASHVVVDENGQITGVKPKE